MLKYFFNIVSLQSWDSPVLYADVAQLAELMISNVGSSPTVSFQS